MWILGTRPIRAIALAALVAVLSVGHAKENQKLVPITGDEGHDEALYDALAEYRAGVAELDQPIGLAEETLPFASRHLELGAWITDCLYSYMNRHLDERIDLVMINRGGIRTALHAGAISTNNITEILPFENSLGWIEFSGEDLLELAAHLASREASNPISGARIHHDADLGLVRMEIRNDEGVYTEVDPEGTYLLGTINFLASGAAGFGILAEREFHDTGVMMRDAVIEEVQLISARDEVVRIPEDYRRYITVEEKEAVTAP
ncbi:MAG: 5'-nucleotidase C-terminal domain-containing protein [Candidatus Sumerlaeia bacterium]|nr:5'-nucleotidase C-terminal domain-containing protein [Candidatus Sumerlaeia bacterium]